MRGPGGASGVVYLVFVLSVPGLSRNPSSEVEGLMSEVQSPIHSKTPPSRY